MYIPLDRKIFSSKNGTDQSTSTFSILNNLRIRSRSQMKARLCIENTTDRPVAAHLEQISVRYWGLVPSKKRVLWDPENVHLDRGAYTLRAFDATSLNYKPPNMKKEKAKAVVGGLLLGAGGVGALVSIPLFAVPGVGLSIAGGVVIGAAAVAGASAAAAGGAANLLPTEYKSGIKRGSWIGKATKYKVKCSDKQELEWEKVIFDEDDMTNDDTIFARPEEQHTNPDNFADLIIRGLSVQSTEQQHPSSHAALQDHQPSSGSGIPDCVYFKKCRRYLYTLDNISSVIALLDSQYDKCFCEECATKRGDLKASNMGNPKQKFAVPWGYAKFGVKVPPQAIERDIFYNWHICYHGTNPADVCQVIECGRLLKPGDKAPDGSLRIPGAGRWTKDTAPDGHNVDQLFFSPTPAYSELYAEEENYIDRMSNQQYEAKTVLQVRIKPGAYTVGPSTVASHKRRGSGPIDPNFSDDELEWKTDYECVHYIYGILIKLENN